MSRALVVIEGPRSRAQAARWCEKAPIGTRIEFKEGKRSGDQNAKLWASLTDIARQVTWPPNGPGVKLSADDWKLVFLDALKSEMRLVPNIAGNGFVNLGRSSSDLSVGEFSDLLELIVMFGAAHGVVFGEPPEPDRSRDGAAQQSSSTARAGATAKNGAPEAVS